MAKHIVKCSVCGQQFDANTIPYVKTSSTRYAHKDCVDTKEYEIKVQNDKDREELIDYIKQLFNYDTLPQMVMKQIKNYKENYKYSYSGILKTLKYIYEVKHNNKEKANGRITLVEYCYDEAYKYYYELWQARQEVNKIDISEYILPDIEVHINRPSRNPMGMNRRKKFSFLEEG